MAAAPMSEAAGGSGLRGRVAAIRPRYASAVAIFAAAFAAWLVLRIVLAYRFPLYGDEGFFTSYTQLAWSNPAQRFVALLDDKGLLATWITAALMGLGLTPLGAVRSYAVLSGLVSAFATTAIAYRVWGKRVAAAVAVVLVLLPYLLVYDVVAEYDPFIAAMAMVALLLQLELVKQHGLDLALLLGFALGAGILTKQSGVFAILLIPVSLLTFDWRRADKRRCLLAWTGCIVVALVVTFLMNSLQYLSTAAYLPAVANHRLLGDALRHPFTYLHASAKPYFQAFIGYLTIPLLLPLGVGLWHGLRTRPRVTVVLVSWILLPALGAALIATVYVPRYALQCVPPLAILMGLGVVRLYVFAQKTRR